MRSFSPIAGLSAFVRSWKLLYLPSVEAPRPWMTAFERLESMLCASLRTSSTSCGCGVWNVTCDPPLKSIPRFRPRTPIETIAIATTTPEIANHSRRLPMKSIWSQRPCCWPFAPMNAGFSNQRKPASSPSIARVANTAVTSEIAVPIRSMSAKPLTPAVATRNRTSAVIAVTTFASMIVWNPFE